MSELVLARDGRSRSPAFHAVAPHATSPALPGRSTEVEEIVAVMRAAGDGPHSRRLRGLIVILWRAGLRVQEALTPKPTSITAAARCLSVAARAVAAAKVGMDAWGCEELQPWLELRMKLPFGPLFCVINGPTRGRPWSSAAARADLRRTAAPAGVRRRFTPHQLRHAHAVEMAREGVPLIVIRWQLGHLGIPPSTSKASTTPRSSSPSTRR